MTEQAIEQEIQDKGLTAPRLTPQLIDSMIVGEKYHVFEGTQTTVACLTLQNGFTVTGESACASPENFDAEIGRKIARENAREKIWLLEGYLLKQKLFEGGEQDAALASSNIKRDNSLLFAEKFLEFNENIVVHDEAVNSQQIELEQMAQEIIAINRSTDTLQA